MCLHRTPTEFDRDRSSGNARLLAASRSARVLSALDEGSYREGSLGWEHKEYMGLAISFAAGCGDCVAYHLQQLVDLGATDEQIGEAVDVLLVGCGSASLPSARDALRFLTQLKGDEIEKPATTS